MKAHILSSLKSRLIAVVLLSALPALAFILWTSQHQKTAAVERARKDVLGIARLTAVMPEGLFEGGRQLLTAIARLDAVRGRDVAECSDILGDLLGRYPIYNNLGCTDEFGQVICGARSPQSPLNLADRSWFKLVRERRSFVVGDYQKSRVTGREVLVFAYPVTDSNSAFRGVVTAALDLEWLQRFVSTVDLPAGATLTITDFAGIVLARKPELRSWIGRRFPGLPPAPSDGRQADHVGTGAGLDGVSRIYASIPLMVGDVDRYAGMYVRVGIPEETAFAEVNRERTGNLQLLGLVVCLVLLVAWVGSEVFILGNLRVLSSATRRLSKGDMTVRAAGSVKVGEFQELASAFDEMAESLDSQFRERERTEARLRESEERYRSVFENSMDGIVLMEPAKRVLAANPAACRMLGREEKAILEARREDIFDTDDPRLAAFIERRSRFGFALAEVSCKRPDGTAFPCEVSSGLFEARGGGKLACLILRDMTERRIMEARLRHDGRMKLLGQIAAGVAHEVRNPLNAILSVTEALFLDLGPNPDYQPYLGHIRTQVDRLSRLMKDLLELGKPIQPSSLQSEFLGEMCRFTLRMWEAASPGRRVKTVWVAPPELETLRVKADVHRFQQVLINLLDNAAVHSAEPADIVVEMASEPDGWAVISVMDRGSGLATENLGRVFEPFFTTRRGGTGLGLSLVRHYIESMEGEVSIRNNVPPPGCTVEIRLPIASEG